MNHVDHRGALVLRLVPDATTVVIIDSIQHTGCAASIRQRIQGHPDGNTPACASACSPSNAGNTARGRGSANTGFRQVAQGKSDNTNCEGTQ